LIVLWARPRTYYIAVLLTALYVTIHPWVVVQFSSVYQSGLLPMVWALTLAYAILGWVWFLMQTPQMALRTFAALFGLSS
jgi:hypothetical protein